MSIDQNVATSVIRLVDVNTLESEHFWEAAWMVLLLFLLEFMEARLDVQLSNGY